MSLSPTFFSPFLWEVTAVWLNRLCKFFFFPLFGVCQLLDTSGKCTMWWEPAAWLFTESGSHFLFLSPLAWHSSPFVALHSSHAYHASSYTSQTTHLAPLKRCWVGEVCCAWCLSPSSSSFLFHAADGERVLWDVYISWPASTACTKLHHQQLHTDTRMQSLWAC